MSRLLNFGCGAVFHDDWVNVDAVPADPRVQACDLRRGLPFPAASFRAAYGSHVLEHLEPAVAQRLLKDCFRVLEPGGIVRIVVPDLEAIVRMYLQSLEGALGGDPKAAWRRDWMLLELYDQAVRSTPRGAMGEVLSGRLDDEQRRFIVSRIGDEAFTELAQGGRGFFRRALRALRRRAASAGAFLFLGAEGRDALREGLFRRSGVVHQWMYDRFSLARELLRAGFLDVAACAADQSAIAGFARYGLETVDGRARKPDSLYMEARKPA